MIDKHRYDELTRILTNAANNAVARPAQATAQSLVVIATILLEETVDHDECVHTEDTNPRGHRHEGAVGMWLWPDEAGKGLYDDSPTGA